MIDLGQADPTLRATPRAADEKVFKRFKERLDNLRKDRAMKTSELSGAALDWAVAKCEGIELIDGCYNRLLVDGRMSAGQTMLTPYKPSTDWAQGGLIIERERIQITPRGETTDMWEAIIFDNIFMDDGSDCFQTGTTPLIAAMRCYVASKLGDNVELPEGLSC